MVESLHKQIINIIPNVEELYNRLILVVGESGSGKTTVLNAVAQEYGTQVVNLNLALSKALLELTTKQRILRLPRLMSAIINEKGSLVVLDNNEILFDEEFKQDPFKLFQGLSRNQTIVTSWNGRYEKNKLIYAEPNHREYRSYDPEETIVISMDGTSTIDIEKSIK